MAASEHRIAVERAFTEDEVHVLVCAMAGNFPPSLNHARMPALRKLAQAYPDRVMADRPGATDDREDTHGGK